MKLVESKRSLLALAGFTLVMAYFLYAVSRPFQDIELDANMRFISIKREILRLIEEDKSELTHLSLAAIMSKLNKEFVHNGEVVDPWRSPIVFSYSISGRSLNVLLRSAGEDKVYNSDDDLIFEFSQFLSDTN